MVIHGQLLKKAQAAAADLAAAERRAEDARTEYHATVRRMHLAGASLREIAQALDISHQRVQQMVDGAGGSWWQQVWRSRNLRGNLSCTFCARTQETVAKLIAGPKVFICDACVAYAEQSLAGHPARSAREAWTLAADGEKGRCSFCGKRRTVDRRLLSGTSGRICSECLGVCRQILVDSTP
jgi:hypothetical protein